VHEAWSGSSVGRATA